MSLPEGLEKLRHAPIFLASTHGQYRVDPPLHKFLVPPNVYIFEASSICETILTSMDQPLWTLIIGENRDMFLQYFTNAKEAKDDKYRKVFQNLHFYKPGDTIYERKLSFSGGKGERAKFATLGFFHFPIESTEHDLPEVGRYKTESTIRLLEPQRTDLIERSENNDVFITNETFIKKYIFPIFPDAKQASIFIFSSCAGVDCLGFSRKEMEDCDKSVQEIEQHQHKQDLQALALGLNNPLSGTSFRLEPPRDIPPRKGKVGQSFAPTRKKTSASNNETYYGENTYRRQAFNIITKPAPKVPKRSTIVYAIEVPNPLDPPKVLDPEKIVSKMYSVPTPSGSPYFTEKGLKKLISTQKTVLRENYPRCRLYKVQGKQFILLEDSDTIAKRKEHTTERRITRKKKKQQL